MRVRAVPTLAGDRHGNLACGGVDKTGARSDRAHWHRGVDMRADDVAHIHRLQFPRFRDVQRTGRVGLLARLQHRHQSKRKVEALCRLDHARKGSEVYVVAARVHRFACRRPLHSRFLRHRQCVQLAADPHRWSVLRSDPADGAGVRDRFEIDAERFPQQVRRGLFFAADARVLVYLPAQVSDVCEVFFKLVRPLFREASEVVSHELQGPFLSRAGFPTRYRRGFLSTVVK